MTVEQLREWLRQWVIKTTGLPAEEITDDKPMQSFGLSSRDVVILSGELENLLDKQLDATIAYQYPTIQALAQQLLAGGPGLGAGAQGERAGAAHNSRTAHATSATDPSVHDIAVVGMAARYPGAPNLTEMWRLLVEGRDGIGPLPIGRWSEYANDPVMSRRMEEVNLTGGYLEDISAFDAEFFGLSPLETVNVDPQQRLVLELTWEALENARIPANTLRGKPVGVYVGSSNNDYGMLITADPAEAHPYALTGTASSIIANRVSYVYDFRGPSISVDTACSSSLVSVHQAVRDLREHNADVALAGGVNILAAPWVSTAFGELGVFSPTGKIHAFSDDADGFVRSDGAGMLVLKRVSDALADGDTILAVIKGSAINSDGHSNGLTAPNPEAQVDVLQRAYADAGVDPSQVDYVEAHGTGTILGDPIEATALGAVLGVNRTPATPTLLGSAKTNFGHTESAAGAAGLIKVVLAMQHNVLPPSLNFTEPNRYINFDAEHLEVVADPREWPEYSGTKLAGVSGFGFGGTNAHVVLSDFNPADYGPEAQPAPAEPALAGAEVALPVSGLLPSRRAHLAATLADFVTTLDDTDLPALARSVTRRNHARSRAVVLADTVAEATKRLRYVADGKVVQGVALADSPAPTGPVFVYSGFGSQHRKMVKDLFAHAPFFRDRLTELDRIVDFESGWSIRDIILDDEQTYDTETAQVAITAIQIALTDYLATLGATPAAVVGMSMGEIAAAYAAGGLSAEDAMLIACHRSRLMGEGEKSLPEDQLGAMAVVEFSVEQLDNFIAENPDFAGIEPAVYAGPGMTTVGGPRQAVLDLVAKLEAEEKFARLLNVKGAGHTTLVEIAPNPVAIMGMMNTAFSVGKPDAQLLYALKRKVPDTHTIPDLLAKLYVAGAPIDFAALYGAGPIVDAPAMPWKKQRYWTSARPAAGGSSGSLLGQKVSLPDGTFAFHALADTVPSPIALMEAVVMELAPGATLVAVEEKATLPPSGELSVLASRNLGGLTIAIHQVLGNTVMLVAEGFASSLGGNVEPVLGTPAVVESQEVSEPLSDNVSSESLKWDPTSGETVEQRMRLIVSEAMGYDIQDLPGELPLIDLGLDSLMGMRIKNRIEHDFSLPSLQVQALRDASVADAVRMVEELVAVQHDTPAPEPVSAKPVDAPKAAEKPKAPEEPAAEPQEAATEEKPTVAEQETQPEGVVKQEKKATHGVGVAPRDASERLVFATWAGLTGAAAAGVTSELPDITRDVAEKIAERLNERASTEITADQVLAAETLEPLANLVREGLESDVSGNIRVLRERPAGSTAPSVFLFHPAGGSSVVYQPLMRRLPKEVPVYGVERLEGSLEERAAAYLDEIERYSDGRPVILGGWSFGGVLAYEVAHQLRNTNVEVATIALLDTVQPAHPAPDTMEETKKRWERYSKFAKKTYNLDFPVPYEILETAGEDALLTMMAEFLANTDPSEHGLSAGVLEHQRASFVDNRILDTVDMRRWQDVDVPVMLFRAERMHDGAIELEPAYAEIHYDGGWSAIVNDLEIVQLAGDHLAVVDEPEISKVGRALTERISRISHM